MKQIIASLVLGIYMIGLSPYALMASEPEAGASNPGLTFREENKDKQTSSDTYIEKKEEPENIVGQKSQETVSVTRTVGRKGGTVALREASVEIPAGALEEDTEITIELLSSVAETDGMIENVTGGAAGYRFLPHGTQFAKAATIRLPYDSALDSKDGRLKTLATWFFNTESGRWEKLERTGIDKEKRVLISRTTHFTDMINATLSLPENAPPLEANINSIKELEAATPNAGIAELEGLEGSWRGDASFSIQVPVTGGRRGMAPQVAITYSSGGGSGMMGKGFDLNYGSVITTDTRLGLPNYDRSDTYMKDGQELVKVGEDKAGGWTEFETRKKGDYEKILALWSGGDATYTEWLVISKDGRRRHYGDAEKSWTGAGDGKKFSWHLTREEDLFGNTITYSYIKINEDNTVYPSEIRYTGHSSTPGSWAVRFEYERDGGGEYATRPDARTDARGRFLAVNRLKLTEIGTYYKNTKIKTIKLSYIQQNADTPDSDSILRDAYRVSYLKTIEMFSGTEINRDWAYSFEYKDTKKENGKYKYFDEAKIIQNGVPIHVSGSTSTGVTGSIGSGAGYGFKQIVDARLTGGATFSTNNSENWTGENLFDIDGDSRPDLVNQTGPHTIKVCLNKGGSFSEEKSIHFINNINTVQFSASVETETSLSDTVGFNFYGGAGTGGGAISLGYAYNRSDTRGSSELTCSFMDMDSDGLLDIIESGKNYYWKNKGNLNFEYTEFGRGSIVINNSRQKLTKEQLEKYDSTYQRQTPFRMWKAPFSGVVEISQTAKIIDKKAEKNDNVYTKVITSSNECEECLYSTDVSTEITENRDARKISAQQEFYFVHDTGINTRNKDLYWNVDVNYKEVPVFSGAKLPFFVFDLEKIYSSENSQTASIIERYGDLYNSSETGDDEKQETYKIYTLKENWSTELSDESLKEIYRKFIEDKKFIPSVLTEELLNRIIMVDSFDILSAKLLERFYVYDINTKLFKLSNNFYTDKNTQEDKKALLNLYKSVYFMDPEFIMDYFNLYKIYGINPFFWDGKSLYKYEEIEQTNNRNEKSAGSVLSFGNEIALGKYNGENIYFSVKEGKIKSYDSKDLLIDASLKNIDDEYCISIDFDSCFVNFFLSEQNTIREDILEKELRKYQEVFQTKQNNKVKNSIAHDWPTRLSVTDRELFFKSFSINNNNYFEETDFEMLLDAVYECKINYEQSSSSEKEEIITWELKENANFDLVQEILDGYLWEKFINEQFPYYKKNNIGTWSLTEESVELLDKGNLHIETCLQEMYNYIKHARYCNIKREIIYKSDYYYPITDEGTINLIKIKNNQVLQLNEVFQTVQTYGNVGHVFYSSEKDFDSKNYVTPYTNTKNGANIITIQSEDILYGGNKGWYYGIWLGDIQEFEIKKLKPDTSKYLDENTGITKDYTKENVNEKSYDKTSFENIDEKEIQVYYTLPSTEYYAEFKDGKESESGIEIYEGCEILTGAVSITAETSVFWSESGRKYNTKPYYSTPLISASLIHVNRIGGPTYYSLTEEDSSKENSSFLFPIIRKSVNVGTDKSWGPSFSAAVVGGSQTTGVNESFAAMLQSVQDINGDGIPDVVQKNDIGLAAAIGTKVLDGSVIYSNMIYLPECIDTLNFTKSKVDSHSVSINPTGAVNLMISSSGKIKESKVTPSINGSVGTSDSFGSNETLKSFCDINGDGLPDWLSDVFYINLGGDFQKNEDYCKYELDAISKSINSSIGINSSLGGALGGKVWDNPAANMDKIENKEPDKTYGESLNCSLSLSGGMNESKNTNSVVQMVIDIDGDGLPDKVSYRAQKFYVSYNSGTDFLKEKEIFLPEWNFNTFDHIDGNFDLGAMNGLPLISGILNGMVSIPDVKPSDVNSALEYSATTSVGINGSLGVNVNIGIDIIVGVIYCGTINITVDVNGGVSGSASLSGAATKFMDIDGDGYVDRLLRVPGVGLYYQRNIASADGYGLINRIRSSTGQEWEIEYGTKWPTSEMPQAKTVMKRVTARDGYEGLSGGEHSVTREYRYSGGYYSREEKDFFGFGKVTEERADGSYLESEYRNREYYSKGTVARSRLFDAGDTLLQENWSELSGESAGGTAECALAERETQRIYGQAGNCIETETRYKYDWNGNVLKLSEYANGEAEPLRTAEFEWQVTDGIINGKRVYTALPTSIKVFGGDGKTLLRRRKGAYNGETGALESLIQWWGAGESECLTYSFDYDGWGNTETATDPAGVLLSYAYDGDEHAYPVRTTKSGGGITYTSTAQYDAAMGLKLSETDINGNTFTYEYDVQGRLESVRSPYDSVGGVPAVRYEYVTPDQLVESERGKPRYAYTRNKISLDSADGQTMDTVVVADGFGRAAATAKRGELWNGGDAVLGWNVSGQTEYDGKGRAVKQYMNRFVAGDLESLLASIERGGDDSLFTLTGYDAMDRTTSQTLPYDAELGECVQETSYGITDGGLSLVLTTDPLGNTGAEYSDAMGNIVRVERKGTDGAWISADYIYNAMGEMTAFMDAKGNAVESEYDMLGRRTSLSSPDSGTDTWEYDEFGNLARSRTSALRERNAQIVYKYDALSRLVRIDYPFSEDTIYEYENTSSAGNRLGKIARVTDESGTTEYEYGKLGETTAEIRTIASSWKNSGVTARTGFRSNYMGQMESIEYPDGETVFYIYDAGGNISKVAGRKDGYGETVYADEIGYDENSQRVHIKYGNGAETTYTYNAARRWLDNVVTTGKYSSDIVQNLSYKFDRAGNVLSRTDDCGQWSITQKYSYDGLYQLTKAEGHAVNSIPAASHGLRTFDASYTQEFAFTEDGLCNLMRKTSSQSEVLEDDLNYNLDYVYEEGKARRLVRAGERHYRYDGSGNLVREQDQPFSETDGEEAVAYHRVDLVDGGTDIYSEDYAWAQGRDSGAQNSTAAKGYYYRDYTWNERNLMSSSKDALVSVDYLYGQDGQRAVKRSGASETLYFGKFFAHTFRSSFTSSSQMAKHIFLGTERIATKQCWLGYTDTYEGANTSSEADQTYYYHSDHLGSVSAITDWQGDVYERLEYTPYGETWIDYECGNGLYESPFRFTGKQRDEETGLYYYGARYLDPKYSTWLSADPALADYFPSAPINDEAKRRNKNLPGMGGVFNPTNGGLYCYAGNNPVRYTDPDGRAFVIDDLVVGIIGIVSVSVLAVSYMQTDTYKDGCEALANVINDGYATAKTSIITTVESIQYNHAVKAKVKELTKEQSDRKSNGSYTITFESGKTYHGKGSLKRAEKSAIEKATEHADFPGYIDWTPSIDNRTAFEDEYSRLSEDGSYRNPSNYNKIQSPGRKLYIEKYGHPHPADPDQSF